MVQINAILIVFLKTFLTILFVLNIFQQIKINNQKSTLLSQFLIRRQYNKKNNLIKA